MKTHRNLWQRLCSYENLELAFRKARRHKTLKPYVIEFEKNLDDNLEQLRTELLFHSYRPKLLVTFTIRDPKTRTISKSDFRDRVIHHALCNIIEPIFDRTFIYDSFANRMNKGTLNALNRFDYFKRKVSGNNTRTCYIFKADIRKYFDELDHEVLIGIINKKIKDKRVIWLIKVILDNHNVKTIGKGMPLGNLTSQFFANVYLNELDYFVKHELGAEYYIRYVDDFIIMHTCTFMLEYYREKINIFLKENLIIELHPDKCRITVLQRGVTFLGFRIFKYHRLLRKSNLRKMRNRFINLRIEFDKGMVNYDVIYEYFQGWFAYASWANTYRLRKRLSKEIETAFPNELSAIEINKLLKQL